MERLEWLDSVHEKRIDSAVYNKESRPSTRVGMSFSIPETVAVRAFVDFAALEPFPEEQTGKRREKLRET